MKSARNGCSNAFKEPTMALETFKKVAVTAITTALIFSPLLYLLLAAHQRGFK